MCHPQVIRYKCLCTTYTNLYPCSLYPEVRVGSKDCPRFQKKGQELTLSYGCPKDVCFARNVMRARRESREQKRIAEENKQNARITRRAVFERWMRAWKEENKVIAGRIMKGQSHESKLYMRERQAERRAKRSIEKASQEERDYERAIFLNWEAWWSQTGLQREEEARLRAEQDPWADVK